MTGVADGGASPNAAVTILIVEDDPGAVEIFTQILTLNGYAVHVAVDAESALQDIQRVNPSAILLDLHLPMADGVEFLRQLRARSPHDGIPIAVITGDYFVEEDMAREVQALGARFHFKPLWEEDLLKLVQDLLDAQPGRSGLERS